MHDSFEHIRTYLTSYMGKEHKQKYGAPSATQYDSDYYKSTYQADKQEW